MNFREAVDNVLSKISGKQKALLQDSKVFCMAPWIQLHAQTNGLVAPCCMSAVHDNNELGDLRKNPDLRAAWNSANMKQLRLNMLQGKKNSICNHCYDYEKVGKFSERMQYNRDFKRYFPRVNATQDDGSLKETRVPLIDLRFSNKCNYKCRICDSAFSTVWYDEEQKIGRPRRPPTFDTEKEIRMAGDEKKFWESYEQMLPYVERLHFAGGEPLVMDEHYRVLDFLISIGKTNVTLSYNTNFSALRYKNYNVIDLWNRFKKVDVWASLDGMGEQGDYQRKGQHWHKIEENIRAVQRECQTVLFGVNVTVSIFNVLHIPEFYRYMVDNKFVEPDRMNLYLLFDPDYFNITNLTQRLKQKVLKQFEEFEKNYLDGLPKSGNIRNHVKAVTTFMMSENGTQQKEFQHWVTAVDELRGEKFVSVFPELAEMIQNEGGVLSPE